MRVDGLSKSGPLREIYTGQENNNVTIGIVYNIFPSYILVTFITVSYRYMESCNSLTNNDTLP